MMQTSLADIAQWSQVVELHASCIEPARNSSSPHASYLFTSSGALQGASDSALDRLWKEKDQQ